MSGVGPGNQLDGHEIAARGRHVDELLGLLGGHVVVGSGGDDVARAVEHVEVELRRRSRRAGRLLRRPGLIELEVDQGVRHVHRDGQEQRGAARVEIHERAGAHAGDGAGGRAKVRQVAVVGLVAGGGEVRDALRGDGVDRLGDVAWLEEGVATGADVVDDDVRLGRVGQRQDVLAELLVRCARGGEREAGAGRDVVDVLGHRAALVITAGPFRQDVHVGGQVARGDVGGVTAQVVEAVADHADVHTRARESGLLGRDVGGGGVGGLVDGRTGALRLQVRLAAHRLRKLGGGGQLVDGQVTVNQAGGRVGVDDLHAQVLERRLEPGEIGVGVDADEHRVALELVERELLGQIGGIGGPTLERLVEIDELAAHVGHRAVLDVRDVRRGRVPPRCASQQQALFEALQLQRIPPSGKLGSPTPSWPLFPTVCLEASHRQTPRFARGFARCDRTAQWRDTDRPSETTSIKVTHQNMLRGPPSGRIRPSLAGDRPYLHLQRGLTPRPDRTPSRSSWLNTFSDAPSSLHISVRASPLPFRLRRLSQARRPAEITPGDPAPYVPPWIRQPGSGPSRVQNAGLCG